MPGISILIPTYNDACLELVEALCQQACELNTEYEIIVADDGSSDAEVIAKNKGIGKLNGCCFVERKENVGRAAIRNYLAQQAHNDWLLFIDSDMTVISPHFVKFYVDLIGRINGERQAKRPNDEAQGMPCVAYGGYSVGFNDAMTGNLRYKYERACARHHTVENRQKHPHHDFHTSNFLVHRSVMLAYPFNERFRHYGFEDVLWGRQLSEAHIDILHVDNPLGFCTFETNNQFISKTEEGLRTLHHFRKELEGYSTLLRSVSYAERLHVAGLLRRLYRCTDGLLKRQLCGSRPSLFLFKLYKLGYYLTLK